MLAWMMYVTMVTLLLSGAALAAEHTARLHRASTRWIWILTIIASLLLPTVIASVSVQMPSMFSPTVSQNIVALREVTSERLSPASWVKDSTGKAPEWRGLDPVLKNAWVVVSAGMLLVLVVTGTHLFLRKRRWAKQTFNGTLVYITADIGPAVVGLLRPRIVVPSWVMQSPRSQQAIVLAHEQSHLDAHDPQLLTIALCLLVAMPWNLPLWWQLRRLRYAIEVDCDARVLRGGHDVNTYGETLIEVGERQSAFIGSVAAMSESKSFLEERIRIMVLKPTKLGRIVAVGLACLSVGMVTVAAQVGPPNAASTTTIERQQVAVNPDVLAGYVGNYQFGKNGVMHITRDGSRLFLQLTGQQVVEVFPESETKFFAKIVDAQISFVKDAQGNTTSLTLHQNGMNQSAPRIDATAAKQIEETTAAKIHSQQPNPGSEAALRRTIDAVTAGKPNLSEMSPELAKATEQQLPKLQPMLVTMGPVQSIAFNGVGNQGWDTYLVRHANGTTQWHILIDDKGIIIGALVSAGP